MMIAFTLIRNKPSKQGLQKTSVNEGTVFVDFIRIC